MPDTPPPYLRDHWYIACTSAQLGRTPRAARVLDHELALWRDAAGQPHAVRDRCSHRGVRLSLGRVEDGALACSYHGWRFAGDGRCVHLPSLVDRRRVPAGCGVPALPCVERCGYVWVWTGAPDRVEAPPDLAGFAARRWSQGSVDAECDWLRALENNLDWCHPVFAHRWTHGQFYLALLHGLREQSLELSARADGLDVRGPHGAAAATLVTLAFTLPCRAEVTGPGARRIVVHCVPTGPQRCRIEWLMSRRWPPGPRVRQVAREPAIFRQDRELLASATPAYTDPTWRERSAPADAPTLLLRRIVELAARGEWDARRAAEVPTRVLQVRA